MKNYQSFAITSLKTTDEHTAIKQDVREYMTNHGLSEAELGGADLIVVIGGDGALLKALRDASSHQHIVALHTGNKGFLTTTHTKDAFRSTIEQARNGSLAHMSIPRIRATNRTSGHTFTFINDISVECTMTWLTIDVATRSENRKTIRGSGVCVCTPIGSTTPMAQFFGCPIMDPTMRAWYVKGTNDMMSPKTGIVLNGYDPLSLTLTHIDHNGGIAAKHHHTPTLYVDGLYACELTTADSIECVYDDSVTLLRLHDDNHWHRIRSFIH